MYPSPPFCSLPQSQEHGSQIMASSASPFPSLPHPEVPPMKKQRTESMPSSSPLFPPNQYYKTRLCPRFITGSCSYGDNCHYAHGQHELRKKLCHTFSAKGVCTYGDRCIYLHPKISEDNRKCEDEVSKMFFANQEQVDCPPVSVAEKVPSDLPKMSRQIRLKKISGIYADWIDGTTIYEKIPIN